MSLLLVWVCLLLEHIVIILELGHNIYEGRGRYKECIR